MLNNFYRNLISFPHSRLLSQKFILLSQVPILRCIATNTIHLDNAVVSNSYLNIHMLKQTPLTLLCKANHYFVIDITLTPSKCIVVKFIN
ncbi:hypothetical protein VP14_156 [Vibrio phage VPMCC14]|nr:hypothetical protein VP14_156 [Vibrio phage VPMCC14]